MLKIYRRHSSTCPFASLGRKHIRCTCPVWCDGSLPDMDGRINCSMDTRNWQVATLRMQDWEAAGGIIEDTRVEVEVACEAFRADAEARNLRHSTLKKYKQVLWQLKQFAEHEGITFIQQIDAACARRFRESWVDAPLSAAKKLERMRQFFKFCVETGWMEKSPAAYIRSPQVPDYETQPYTREEMARILAAAARMQEAAKVRAFVLLQRYSGLRIGDAASLEKIRIDGAGRLFLYTAKSKTPVRIPLPPIVIEALNAFTHVGRDHFFWTGASSLETLTGNWRRTLRRLFELAEMTDGHAHRFRDTFAVELLLAGTPIEEVSRLLGHRSIRVTERHYAAWVKARQERAEALVKTSWASDPFLSEITKQQPGSAATYPLQVEGNKEN